MGGARPAAWGRDSIRCGLGDKAFVVEADLERAIVDDFTRLSRCENAVTPDVMKLQ